MDELKNIAKVNYTFLDKKSEIYTNEVVTDLYKDSIDLVDNIYIPINLPGIFEIDFVELLNYNIRIKSSEMCKNYSVLKLDFGISLNYVNIFFNNQRYIKSFCHDFVVKDNIDIKKATVSMIDYNKLTDRLIRLHLKLNF